MKYSSNQQQSIVTILLRYWEEIITIETEFSLLVGKGDTRPRIEYFHDAIRAYTSLHKTTEMEQRLSIERLAYDVRCLRYIATMPLASITHDEHNLSPKTLPAVIAPGLIEVNKRIGRDAKDRLCELYQQYGVLFASLLKATAENDVHERSDALDNEVEEINRLVEALTNNASVAQINNIVQHLSDAALKRDLLALLPQIKGKNASGLADKLKANIQKKDKQLKEIDTASHQYATTQLAIYESAKDMLKQMAKQGMNLVGEFVESTLRQNQQGRGR